MRCTTTSGPYQCDRVIGHAGECECTPDTSTSADPAGDAGRASAYLRGVLDKAGPAGLDRIGNALNVRRNDDEPDIEYRERIWAAR